MAEDAMIYRADPLSLRMTHSLTRPDLPRGCCCRGTYP